MKVEIHSYSTLEEMKSLWDRHMEFDIIAMANDFSSVDVLENLKVTFLEKNPYIIVEEKSKIIQTLKKAMKEEIQENRYPLYEEIAKSVLENAYIVPLGYHRMIFYIHKSIDVSRWPVIYPLIPMKDVSVQGTLEKDLINAN